MESCPGQKHSDVSRRMSLRKRLRLGAVIIICAVVRHNESAQKQTKDTKYQSGAKAMTEATALSTTSQDYHRRPGTESHPNRVPGCHVRFWRDRQLRSNTPGPRERLFEQPWPNRRRRGRGPFPGTL